MSSYMAVATKEQPVSVRRSKMDFRDGMLSITAKEQRAIWDVVAAYIQEQLLLLKGVRIPTLGSFDVVPKWNQLGKEAMIIQTPVFRLARNLAGVHNLENYKDDLPDSKELETLKYAKVATAASLSRQKVKDCIQGTTSLLSQCLGKGENVALVLRDVGVLLIEGKRAQMKFYSDFLERITGKRIWERVAFKVPQLLSRVVPIASLTFTRRVIIFPEFELEFVNKPPARDSVKALRNVPHENKWKKKEALPPLRQDKQGPAASQRRSSEKVFPVPVGLAELPLPARSSLTGNEAPQLWENKMMEKRKSSAVMSLSHKQGRLRDVQYASIHTEQRWLPEIPGDSSGKKQRVTGQLEDKPAPKGQASKKSQVQAVKPRRCRGGEKGEKQAPTKSKLLSIRSEASTLEKSTYKVFIQQQPRPEAAQLLKSRPEMFWSVLKEPQKTILAGYSFEPSLLMPPMYNQPRSTQCNPLKSRSEFSRMQWPWLA